MKGHAEFPELEKLIDEHARAVAEGNLQSAKAFLSSGDAAHDEFVSKIRKGSIKGFIKLGRARIGMQHM